MHKLRQALSGNRHAPGSHARARAQLPQQQQLEQQQRQSPQQHESSPKQTEMVIPLQQDPYNQKEITKEYMVIHAYSELKNCAKIFTDISQLHKHQKAHSSNNENSKLFECTFKDCEQKFTLKSNLKRHQKIHTKERPFLCNECEKSFATTTNLKQHLQIHKGQRMIFECEINGCTKKYYYLCNLKKHKKQHEQEQNSQTPAFNNATISNVQRNEDENLVTLKAVGVGDSTFETSQPAKIQQIQSRNNSCCREKALIENNLLTELSINAKLVNTNIIFCEQAPHTFEPEILVTPHTKASTGGQDSGTGPTMSHEGLDPAFSSTTLFYMYHANEIHLDLCRFFQKAMLYALQQSIRRIHFDIPSVLNIKCLVECLFRALNGYHRQLDTVIMSGISGQVFSQVMTQIVQSSRSFKQTHNHGKNQS